MTFSNDFIFKALFISITVHTLIVCGNYLFKMPDMNKIKEKRVEISYRPPNPKSLDIKQHLIKPSQKLDLQDAKFSTKDSIGIKLAKDNQSLKGLTMVERKPTLVKSMQANFVTVTPMSSEKANSPIYTSYSERVRANIQEKVFDTYDRSSKTEHGKVYLTFVLSSNGTLKEYQIIDEKTKASQNLRYMSTKSLKEAHFPPFLKGMSLPEYSFNIEIDYQTGD